MGLRDLLFAVPIAGLALWVLWRTTFRSGGKCAGCSGGCASPPRRDRGLVTLGGAGRARRG